MTSERRPLKPSASAQSSRRSSPQKSSGPLKPAKSSGRSRPAQEEAEDEHATLKRVMFIGSGLLVVIVIVLFAMKAHIIFGPKPEPPKKKVIDHSKMLDEVDQLAQKAATQFAAAKKITNENERNKAIRGALETLGAAEEKLAALMDRPEYKGEEYDLVFEGKRHKLAQERKIYRDSITVGNRR